MNKIFEICTRSLNISKLSFEEFKNLFTEEKKNIEKYLQENFDNPEKMSYFDFKIDYGKMGHPMAQTLYTFEEQQRVKRENHFDRAYESLKESENWEKIIGYRIYINEQNPQKNPRELSYSSFGEIEFLFDENLTKELQEKDRKLHEDVMRFYNDSRSNFRGD